MPNLWLFITVFFLQVFRFALLFRTITKSTHQNEEVPLPGKNLQPSSQYLLQYLLAYIFISLLATLFKW